MRMSDDRIGELDRLVIMRDFPAALRLCQHFFESAQVGRMPLLQGASAHGVLASPTGGLRISLSPDLGTETHTIVLVLYLQCCHEFQANEGSGDVLNEMLTDQAALKYMHMHG